MPAAVLPFKSAGLRDALLDWLQMLSGVGLVLFMWCHMLLLSSSIFGAGAFDAVAGFLEDTGLAQVGGPLVFCLFLAHFLLAARKIPFTAGGWSTAAGHMIGLRQRDTLLWGAQVVTGLGILVMGSIHLWVVLNDLPIGAVKSGLRASLGGWPAFYVLFLPVIELHLWIGLYRMGVKWGFVTRENRAKTVKILAVLFVVFWVVGILASRSLIGAAGDPVAAVSM